MPEIISLKDARDRQLKYYFTGVPCKLGHISERLVSGKRCLECDKVRRESKKTDHDHMEKLRAYAREYNKNNQEARNAAKRLRYKQDSSYREGHKNRNKDYYRTEIGRQAKIKARNRYRALKLNALAHCINKAETEKFYIECPQGYEVDHIIPLSKGGNHDISNLQYLTKALNVSKKDRHYTEIDLPIFCIPCEPVL